MNFIKSIILSLVITAFFTGHQLSADDAVVAGSTQTSVEGKPVEIKILEFLGDLSKAQDTDLLTSGMSCETAKFLCGTSACCSWAKSIEKDSCSSLCPQAQSFCDNCPSKYKAACDLGCKYVSQCAELCPCLQAHCSN